MRTWTDTTAGHDHSKTDTSNLGITIAMHHDSALIKFNCQIIARRVKIK